MKIIQKSSAKAQDKLVNRSSKIVARSDAGDVQELELEPGDIVLVEPASGDEPVEIQVGDSAELKIAAVASSAIESKSARTHNILFASDGDPTDPNYEEFELTLDANDIVTVNPDGEAPQVFTIVEPSELEIESESGDPAAVTVTSPSDESEAVAEDIAAEASRLANVSSFLARKAYKAGAKQTATKFRNIASTLRSVSSVKAPVNPAPPPAATTK